MNVYWDSSALVLGAEDPAVRARLLTGQPRTRPHALAETFATLTGGRRGYRVDSEKASTLVAARLRFIELSAEDTLEALAAAKARGVRGGRTHDLLHAVAARKAECSRLLTVNLADFEGLDPELAIETP